MTSTLFPMEATGAIASAGCLYIATIRADADGRLRLVKSRSGEVRLIERTQLSLQMFATYLVDFLQAREIDRMTYVYAPDAGSHMALGSSYRIEAVVQLLPVSVKLVSPTTVTSLAGKAERNVPAPDHDRLSAEGRRVQARAILAAVHELRLGRTTASPEPCSISVASEAAPSHSTEVPDQHSAQEGDTSRRQAVAEKSRRARERREGRRREATLEVRAAAALREQLEYEHKSGGKGPG